VTGLDSLQIQVVGGLAGAGFFRRSARYPADRGISGMCPNLKTLIRRHPERSGISGGAKDLPPT